MEKFSPKVTLEIEVDEYNRLKDEYNRLKDISYLVGHCLERPGFQIIEQQVYDPLSLIPRDNIELQIDDTALLYFFNDLFGVDKIKIYRDDELKMIIEKEI